MKIPFILEVPDFKKDVEKEMETNPIYDGLSPKDKALYVNSLVLQRSVVWSCRTSAAAYNLFLFLFALLLLVQGPAILTVVQDMIRN
jgi:hypothetical protein